MTRIDFYLLDAGNRLSTSSIHEAVDSDSASGYDTTVSRDMAVCRLANKAYLLGHRIYIHTTDAAETRRLDQLLWTFSAGSFVPHAANGDGDEDMPVVIGPEAPPDAFDDVLISLTPRVPECFSRFQRVADVVGPGDEDKRLARDRFRFYRDRGYVLQTHAL